MWWCFDRIVETSGIAKRTAAPTTPGTLDLANGLCGAGDATPVPANLRRRSAIHFGEHRVEPAQAPEAGAQGDIGHGEVRGIEQTLGALYPHRASYLGRCGTDVASEQPRKLPGTDTEPARQDVY